jgi:hypothetical protein
LKDAIQANTDAINAANDQEAERLRFSQQLLGQQSGVFLSSITEFISSQMAGPAWLGAATPAVANQRVRY